NRLTLQGQLGIRAQAVPLWIEPVTRPAGTAARAYVGRVAQPQSETAWQYLLQIDLHWHDQPTALLDQRIDPHLGEVATVTQVLGKARHQVGIIGITHREGLQALQQALIDGKVALEAHRAKTMPWPTGITQMDICRARLRVDTQT